MKTLQRQTARPSLDDLWIMIGIGMVVLRVFLTPIPANDFWWHMATGRLIAAGEGIPSADQFSFTRAGEPFYNQSWLAQWLLFTVYEVGGVALLVWLQAAVIAGGFGLLLAHSLRASSSPRLAVLALLATIFTTFDNWIVRPQSYAIPLFAAYVVILRDWRFQLGGHLRLRLWLVLPLLGALWVNLHGSFVLGGALIGLTFMSEMVRRFSAGMRGTELATPLAPLGHLLLSGILVGFSWLFNPGGLAVLGYVGNLLSSSQVTTLVTEWAAPTIRTPNGAIFFLFVLLLIASCIYGPRPPLTDLLIAAVLFWLALGALRNILWFALAAMPLLVYQWSGRQRAFTVISGTPTLNRIFIGALLIGLVIVSPPIKPQLNLPPEIGNMIDANTPVAAVAAIAADPNPPKRIFSELGYASYQIWALPSQPVFIDPRIELYPYEQWRDYIRLGAGSEVDDLLAAYQLDGALLDRETQAGLETALRARPDWAVRYEDERTIYLVRTAGE